MKEVKKRNGNLVSFDAERINRMLERACAGIDNVSISEIVRQADLSFSDGMKTERIQQELINASESLIDANNTEYDKVTQRLIRFDLYKRVFGSNDIPDAKTHFKNMISKGYYSIDFNVITDAQWDEINEIIDHTRDDDLSSGSISVIIKKYLISNRNSDEIYETPQFMFARASLIMSLQETDIVGRFKRVYDGVSKHYINMPSPVLNSAGTNTKQFSSCVLIETGDNIESIGDSVKTLIKYTTNNAGIGLNYGRMRGIGSDVRHGRALHTGVTGFLRLIESAVDSCSQGGFRKGSTTVTFPFWHYEMETILELKNEHKSTKAIVPNLDYNITINKYFYDKMKTREDIYLLDPNGLDDLYNAYNSDDLNKFIKLYEGYCKDNTVRKIKVNAYELGSQLVKSRIDTGRYYIQNIDNTNKQGMFKDSITMSNLCLEITLPTAPLKNAWDKNDEGEIALCTLSAINFGKFDKPSEMRETLHDVVRMLDAVFDYQDYPVPVAGVKAKKRRSLGIGITNFAYFLAKRGLGYNKESLPVIQEWMEHFSYYIIEGSNILAKEKGKCEWFDLTEWAEGKLPIDKYHKGMDALVEHKLTLDWEALRADIAKHGLRNSALMACMPVETSSIVSNTTNGIEPIRALVVEKNNTNSRAKSIAPEASLLKDKYSMVFDMKSPKGYLAVMGVIQKFIDQSISSNTTYNQFLYENHNIPMSTILNDIIFASNIGIKTLYYSNTKQINDVNRGVHEIECSSCKI